MRSTPSTDLIDKEKYPNLAQLIGAEDRANIYSVVVFCMGTELAVQCYVCPRNTNTNVLVNLHSDRESFKYILSHEGGTKGGNTRHQKWLEDERDAANAVIKREPKHDVEMKPSTPDHEGASG